MIHDLDLTTVIDAQGVLTETFTGVDSQILDICIETVEVKIDTILMEMFLKATKLSEKLAIIQKAKDYNSKCTAQLIRTLQNEL